MNNVAHTGRTKALTPCECGCGETTHFARLVVLKGPEYEYREPGSRNSITRHRTFFVLPGCKDQLENELIAQKRMHDLLAVLRSVPFFMRWKFARTLWSLSVCGNIRMAGRKQARKSAWRAVWLFMLPQVVALQLAAWWDPVSKEPAVV